MNLFILGHGPLPVQKNISMQTAYGLRTWQILSTLGEAKFTSVTLVLIAEKSEPMKKMELFGHKVMVHRLAKSERFFGRKLKALYRAASPDLCLGINNYASYRLALLKPKVPFWADLNGYIMGEAQSEAFQQKADAYIPILAKREKTILREADKLSTVSTRQKSAVLAELAFLGRLNHMTECYEFVEVIKNANELKALKVKAQKPKSWALKRGDFKVLFSGTYNTWLDQDRLLEVVMKMMKSDERVQYVSTGEPSQEFLQKVKRSKYASRFHFLGWVKNEELYWLYEHCDLAINLDRDNTESYFGARNRINEWLSHKLPVLSTTHTEITSELSVANALIDLDEFLSDPASLMKADHLKKTSKNALEFSKKHYSYKTTCAELASWLKSPTASPDKTYHLRMSPSLVRRLIYRINKEGLFFLIKRLWQKIK
jgi:glycosyltransferase involved in cell wall biosynthesis